MSQKHQKTQIVTIADLAKELIENPRDITPPEEEALITTYKSSHGKLKNDAANTIVLCHQPKVETMARRYVRRIRDSNGGCDKSFAEDLASEGTLALYDALEGFEFGKGARFRTYAGYHINKRMVDAILTESRKVQVPRYMGTALQRYNKIMQEQISGSGQITVEEAIEKACENDPTNVKNLAMALASDNTHTTPHEVAQETMTSQLPNPFEAAQTREELEKMGELIETPGILKERERGVVKMTYLRDKPDGSEYSDKEIADALGIPNYRSVSVYRGNALKKLREKMQ